jgi:hypothetical protein
VEQRITMLQELKNRIQDLYQQLPEVCQCHGTENCAPASSPIQCAFGEASLNVYKGNRRLR